MDTVHLPPVSQWQNADEDRVPIRIPRKRYRQIEQAVLDLYEETDVHTIPFDVLRMVSAVGIQLIPYVSLSREAQQWARKVSKDAFMPWGMDGRPTAIFYNSKMPASRLKFTLMHELAHARLLHIQHSELAEKEANTFTAAALCPLPLIGHYGIEDVSTLARVFEISEEFAEHRLEQYEKWKRLPIQSRNVKFGMSVCSRFHLNVPYQPDLPVAHELPKRICG